MLNSSVTSAFIATNVSNSVLAGLQINMSGLRKRSHDRTDRSFLYLLLHSKFKSIANVKMLMN